MNHASLINPTNARIFRITHVDNVPWILQNGIHCRSSSVQDPNFRDIGNPELIAKRADRSVPVPPGGTLSDYIPFYFTPFWPMLYNIKTGYNGMKQTPMDDIALLVTSLRLLAKEQVGFVTTDRHAYLAAADWATDLKGLDAIDWELLQRRDFKRDGDDPGKFERYQAEALVHRHLQAEHLTGIIVHSETARARIQEALDKTALTLKIAVKPEWYF